MAVKDNKTEQHILDTAMHVFFTEGRLHATTQDIADAAGVNRTLIHYYFRSRDQLFDAVFERARLESVAESKAVLSETLPFRKKVEKFIDVFMKRLKTYPYLEISMITSLNDAQAEKKVFPHPPKDIPMQIFLKEVQEQMDQGTIIKSRPVHFVINLFALIVYPFMVKPLNQHLFGLSEHEYEKIVNERKKVILNTIFK